MAGWQREHCCVRMESESNQGGDYCGLIQCWMLAGSGKDQGKVQSHWALHHQTLPLVTSNDTPTSPPLAKNILTRNWQEAFCHVVVAAEREQEQIATQLQQRANWPPLNPSHLGPNPRHWQMCIWLLGLCFQGENSFTCVNWYYRNPVSSSVWPFEVLSCSVLWMTSAWTVSVAHSDGFLCHPSPQ